ncbi:hypothetical protein Tco_0366919 [Tanacetum coccineum]
MCVELLRVGCDPFCKKLIWSSSSRSIWSGVEMHLKVEMACTGLSDILRVIQLYMVVESEVLNDFLRFVSILISEFAGGDVVNLALEMKGDMIVKKLDLKPTIDAMMRDFL